MSSKKPHAVCIPYPAQGHINPFLKLAKILHCRGFHITYVNTEYNHKRLLRTRGPNSLDGLLDFRFEAIPDGLESSEVVDATQDIPSLCESISKNFLAPFCYLISRLNNEGPPVTCLVADGCMSFSTKAAEQFGIPVVLFWTPSACSVLAYAHYHRLVDLGYTPLKDSSYVTNGYLETTIDWIPGMKDIRLRDLPSFIRTTDSNDILLNFMINEVANMAKGSAVVLNTFEALENDVLKALSSMYTRVYTIGPLQLLSHNITKDNHKLRSICSNLWKEEPGCIDWLNTQSNRSVVYVNFGSITVMNTVQMTEFAWGLANSKKPFLWIIRPDLVTGKLTMLPEQFFEETEERSMLASWCRQEEVLKHKAIGGFLTHCGWNSMLESICGGVPILCWPFFDDQHTNCKYSCDHWGIGMEIDNDVKRDEVDMVVRELMDGEKGKKMKNRAFKWKLKAEAATESGGSSFNNLEKLLDEVLLSNC
ncbi:hypothetical protein Leryth_025073 [Lithospermum erythrorhizon]|nr:hypothetical protein Leryth_025073 [Lithospermum erythrorhizon]